MSDQSPETPESIAEPSDVGEELARPGVFTRLGIIGFSRLLIGLLGISGFVLGVIVAWRSTSATTLLIVSAILLLFAALGLDWSEIRGTGPGGWTVQLLRSVEHRIEQVASGEDVPPAIREELEALRAEVKALAPPERSRRRISQPRYVDALVQELMRPKAAHSFQGTDAVRLSLRVAGSYESLRCVVTTPNGRAIDVVTRRPLSAGLVGVSTFVVTYPNDFPGSEPLIAGRYNVEWRRVARRETPSSTLATLLAETAAPALASDSFTIPEVPGTERAPTPEAAS